MQSYRLLPIFIGIFSCTACLAQYDAPETLNDSKLFFKVYGAYGLLTPGSFRGISNSDNNDVNVVKVQKQGMGGGIRAGAGLGFILNKYINIGIDGEYLKGNTIKVSVGALTGASVTTQGSITYNHEVLSVIPNIVFKAYSGPSYTIYNRIGLVVGLPLNITEKEQSEYHFKNLTVGSKEIQQTDSYTTANGKDKLKNALGYQGALGVQVNLSDNLRGFFEIAVYGISFDRIEYRDVARVVTRTDTRKDVSAPVTNIDNSILIKKYEKTGWTNYDVPPPGAVTGTHNNQITTSTLPQSPVNMNSITAGIGIAYRF
jgi:opacity protein-like surface antigen